MNNRLKNTLIVPLIMLGVFNVLYSFVLMTGIGTALIADRWGFYIREEGVMDNKIVYKISDRLAKDSNSNWWIFMLNGAVMIICGTIIHKYENRNVSDKKCG